MQTLKNYFSSLLLYMILSYTFFACIAHVSIVFTIILYSIIIIAPLLLNDTKTISFYAYSACFMSCLGKSGFLIALNISLLLLESKKLVLAIKTKEHLAKIKKLFITWLSLLGIFTVYSVLYNKFHVHRMGMFIDFIQCVVVCALVSKNINTKTVLLHLFVGIISSSIIGIMLNLTDTFSPFIAGHIENRFGAFFNNINTLAVYCTLCASCFISLILTHQLEFKKYCYFPIISTLVGLLTYSKAFILINIILYLAWIILSFISSSNKKRFCLIFILCIPIIIFICIIAKDYIHRILNRFLNTNYDSIMENLTTGRAEIWKQYIKRWLKSPITFLFGNGYTAPKIASNQYEHSVYIALLFQFGVLGTACIIALLIWSILRGGKLSKRVASYLPLALLLINGLVSNLSGVLCTCLPWLLVIHLMIVKPSSTISEDSNLNS